ncbi:MAG: hypothetical protein KDH16_18885 [Rhodocyclaceae bacterium]|nr:hypothetical protein [Rhodocyclaceae bacterium]
MTPRDFWWAMEAKHPEMFRRGAAPQAKPGATDWNALVSMLDEDAE